MQETSQAELLARIDERVSRIMQDIGELKEKQHCRVHAEKLKNLERIVYGVLAATLGLLVRAVYSALS